MRDRSFDDSIAEIYAEDPDFAIEMIGSLLEDGEPEEIFAFLIQVTKAFGLTEEMTQQTGLDENDLRWPGRAGTAVPSLEKLKNLLQVVKLHVAEKRVATA